MFSGKVDYFKDSFVRVFLSSFSEEPVTFLPTDYQQYDNENSTSERKQCKHSNCNQEYGIATRSKGRVIVSGTDPNLNAHTAYNMKRLRY